MESNDLMRHGLGMRTTRREGLEPASADADDVMGNHVCSKEGEYLGKVMEFMIDQASGKIAYAVLSFGGVLGMGNKLFVVPWLSLELDVANKRYTLGVLKDSLEDAPRFDRIQRAPMADKTWAAGVIGFYGVIGDRA